RINLSGDLRRSVQAHGEVEADLGEERQVRSEARRDDHSVRGLEPPPVFAHQDCPTILDEDPLDTEPGDEGDIAVFDGLLCPQAHDTALALPVSRPATARVATPTAAQRPGRP